MILRITVHGPDTEPDDFVLGDKVAIVCGVFRGELGCAKPEWFTAALDLSPCKQVSVANKGVSSIRTSLIMA